MSITILKLFFALQQLFIPITHQISIIKTFKAQMT